MIPELWLRAALAFDAVYGDAYDWWLDAAAAWWAPTSRAFPGPDHPGL